MEVNLKIVFINLKIVFNKHLNLIKLLVIE